MKLQKVLLVILGKLGWAAFIAVVIYWSVHIYQTDSQNAECDRICIEQGYPAGECMPVAQWKHDACVCWPTKPGTAVHFLLERD